MIPTNNKQFWSVKPFIWSKFLSVNIFSSEILLKTNLGEKSFGLMKCFFGHIFSSRFSIASSMEGGFPERHPSIIHLV